MSRRRSANEYKMQIPGVAGDRPESKFEPIRGVTTMFMTCTISEDRTGTEEDIIAQRLASLGARCERKMDWRKIR
jgi:hypothetical protein